jgi:hypothetical protein
MWRGKRGSNSVGSGQHVLGHQIWTLLGLRVSVSLKKMSRSNEFDELEEHDTTSLTSLRSFKKKKKKNKDSDDYLGFEIINPHLGSEFS